MTQPGLSFKRRKQFMTSAPTVKWVTMLRLENVHGPRLAPHLDALGALRIAVFRDYPYLYDGTLDYERDYLRTYLTSPDSLVVLVIDDETLVGASTCLPLAQEGPEFQAPFGQAGLEIDGICYFGESILLPDYRGRGIGKRFFQRREEHAQKLGARLTTFCAVDRPDDHPLRPPGYRPLDEFWTSLGYLRRPELRAEFVWKEIGEAAESPKPLTFWTRDWP